MIYDSIFLQEDRYLIYSKIATDSLPITTTSISSQPCLNPTQSSNQKNYYPTELDRLPEDCSEYLGEKYDNRFTNTGLQLSQYELQSTSHVINLLLALPQSENYIDVEEKKQQTLNLWTRPTIEWKLSCESDNAKQEILETI